MTDSHSEYSYIRRRGRATKAQTRGLELIDKFRIEPAAIAELDAPIGIEIGFGMGQALLGWGLEDTQLNLVGIELYQPGLGALADALEREGLQHVHIVDQPAQEVLRALPAGSLQEVRILFPDPWPKKRHAKRRLIQPEFIAQVTAVLADQGRLQIATDWDPYAAWIREVMSQASGLQAVVDKVRAPEDHSNLREQSTKYEARGERLGHQIHDLVYVRDRNSANTESR